MMQTITVQRNELKFYINYIDYKVFHTILQNHLEQDTNAVKTNGYIRSLYFDTDDDRDYNEKQAGVLNRKKYRLRIYDMNTKKVKFEIKNKFNNQILKETAVITREDAIKIQNLDYEVLLKYNNPTLNKIYCAFKKFDYRPTVIVEYTREAFGIPFNNIRITFDKNLKTCTNNLDLFSEDEIMKPLLPQGVLILEVKYNNYMPDWIKKLIQIPRFEKSAISKYCIGRIENYI